MLKNLVIFSLTLLLFGCATLTYKESLQSWDSYKDVGRWLQINFEYRKVTKHRSVKEPEDLYNSRWGNCVDASHFATELLNKINPKYQARLIYLKNSLSWRGHYSTAFVIDDKIYVMDYGTGASNKSPWKRMEGVHGPYNSLDEYKKFANSLPLQGFHFESVYYATLPSSAI